MSVYLTILLQFLLISSCILFLFKLRDKLGLAPLYILLGSVQYIQALSGSMISLEVFSGITVYPASVVMFSAVLFAVLLIYIKEGVASARALIIGIIISNFIISALFSITNTQEILALNGDMPQYPSAFAINYKYFLTGTSILLVDFILLVIIYQFLVSKISRLYFFLTLFASLFIVLIFDAVAFNVALKFNFDDFSTSLYGHLVGKSISALIFTVILYVYLEYVDKETNHVSFIANQNRDIFSIFKYRKRYLDLKEEKKEVEQKLTSQLETSLDNISDGFVSLDTNWCYTYINKKAAEFLGKSPESLIGKHIWTEFPEGVGLPFYKAYFKAVETQKTIYLEDYYEPFDKWFENRIYPSSEGLTIYFTDITDKRKVELALKESEKYLESIINNIGDPVFVKDEKSEFLIANNAFYSLFNRTREEIIGRDFADDVPQEQRERYLNIDRKVLSEGIEIVDEGSTKTKEGEPRYISTKKTRFIDDSGKKYLIGTIRDITKLKQTEQTLKENRDYLDNIINNIGDPLFVKDDQSRLIIVNEAFCKIFNLPKEDIIGKTIAEEVTESEQEAFLKVDREVIATGVENVSEETLTVRDGETKYISTKKTRFIDSSGNKYLIGIIRDITERKKTEVELERHKNNLEELIEIRTEEINNKNNELQRMNKLFVGRELKMKELKNVIKELQNKND